MHRVRRRGATDTTDDASNQSTTPVTNTPTTPQAAEIAVRELRRRNTNFDLARHARQALLFDAVSGVVFLGVAGLATVAMMPEPVVCAVFGIRCTAAGTATSVELIDAVPAAPDGDNVSSGGDVFATLSWVQITVTAGVCWFAVMAALTGVVALQHCLASTTRRVAVEARLACSEAHHRTRAVVSAAEAGANTVVLLDALRHLAAANDLLRRMRVDSPSTYRRFGSGMSSSSSSTLPSSLSSPLPPSLLDRVESHATAVRTALAVNRRDCFGRTPLWATVVNRPAGACEVARFLLSNGAEVDAVVDGLTALTVACRYKDEEMVGVLLEAGANPHGLSWRMARQPLYAALGGSRFGQHRREKNKTSSSAAHKHATKKNPWYVPVVRTHACLAVLVVAV